MIRNDANVLGDLEDLEFRLERHNIRERQQRTRYQPESYTFVTS